MMSRPFFLFVALALVPGCFVSLDEPPNATGLPDSAGVTDSTVPSDAILAPDSPHPGDVAQLPDATISAPSTVTARQGGYLASVAPATAYSWTISGGTIVAGADTRQVTFTAGISGSVVLTCTVRNAAGKTDTKSATLTIVPPVLIGIHFIPMVPSGKTHGDYLADIWPSLIAALQKAGINAIFFETWGMTYHFETDAALDGLEYSPSRGFRAAEARQMVDIARASGMKVFVAMQIVSHQTILSYAHPEYMLPEAPYQASSSYARGDIVESNGAVYQCKPDSPDTTSCGTAPLSDGTYWKHTCRTTRDPLNPAAERIVFAMIDELVGAFSSSEGVKPDGFSIESDELERWPTCPGNCGGKTSAMLFGDTINRAYSHIAADNPDMDVLMWGDMLDVTWNGGIMGTADAVDRIDKNIIIQDWRYVRRSSLYDFATATFSSVSMFADKGFRVWPASWNDLNATTDLVWTENNERLASGRVWGHLFTTWDAMDVDLPDALAGKTTVNDNANAIAACILKAVPLVDIHACRQHLRGCGTYPTCTDCSSMSTVVGNQYHDYDCVAEACTLQSILKSDLEGVATSFWDFTTDATDRIGANHGTLVGAAALVDDADRGKVLALNGGYVQVLDSPSLEMSDELSISLWFRLDKRLDNLPDGRAALVSKDYREYELDIYPYGRIHTYTYGANDDGYDEGISAYLSDPPGEWAPGQWYHVLWTMSGQRERVYIDGILHAEHDKVDPGTVGGTHELDIGQRSGGGLPFPGAISDVMLFPTELRADQARALYHLYSP